MLFFFFKGLRVYEKIVFPRSVHLRNLQLAFSFCYAVVLDVTNDCQKSIDQNGFFNNVISPPFFLQRKVKFLPEVFRFWGLSYQKIICSQMAFVANNRFADYVGINQLSLPFRLHRAI